MNHPSESHFRVKTYHPASQYNGIKQKKSYNMGKEQQTDTGGNSRREKDRKRSVEGEVYEIRVKGHLDDTWARWFDGLAITHEEDGTTALTGSLVDQPALHGLLIRIRDLGLSLVSVNCVESDLE
jgi:hypothetical protein